MTGDVPFKDIEIANDFQIISHITVDKSTPSRPQGALFSDELWRILTDCWRFEPDGRPSMEEVIHKLDMIVLESPALRVLYLGTFRCALVNIN